MFLKKVLDKIKKTYYNVNMKVDGIIKFQKSKELNRNSDRGLILVIMPSTTYPQFRFIGGEMKWITLFLIVFLFTACPKHNSVSPQQKTYKLIVENRHKPTTFNIWVDGQFITLLESDTIWGEESQPIIKDVGKFYESESTHFQSFLADSPFLAIDDMIINTTYCDSILWSMGSDDIIFWYE